MKGLMMKQLLFLCLLPLTSCCSHVKKKLKQKPAKSEVQKMKEGKPSYQPRPRIIKKVTKTVIETEWKRA